MKIEHKLEKEMFDYILGRARTLKNIPESERYSGDKAELEKLESIITRINPPVDEEAPNEE